MAKRRLSQWMRDKLRAGASELIDPKIERRVQESAYKKAAPLVRKCVHLKFPPKDMVICEKYGVADIDDCIKLQFPSGVVQIFNFDDGTGPVVTRKTYHGQIYLTDKATADAVEAWVSARDAFKSERDKRIKAYGALIAGANYVEDIAAIWPGAAELVPPNALPIALGPEQIALVKADIRERSAGCT